MENLSLWEKVCHVPQECLSPYEKGSTKLTQIDPAWRLYALTEQFGPCGFGWWYEITGQWIERITPSDARAFCNINLYYRMENGEASRPIPGTGGFRFVYQSSDGVTYGNDEAYKSALTDAISVAAKALGVGADVYLGKQSHIAPEEQPHSDEIKSDDAVNTGNAPSSTLDCADASGFHNSLCEDLGNSIKPEPETDVCFQPAEPKDVETVNSIAGVPSTFEECLGFRFTHGEYAGKTAGEIINTDPEWFVKKDDGFKKRRTNINSVSPAVAAQMRVIMICAEAVRKSGGMLKAS